MLSEECWTSSHEYWETLEEFKQKSHMIYIVIVDHSDIQEEGDFERHQARKLLSRVTIHLSFPGKGLIYTLFFFPSIIISNTSFTMCPSLNDKFYGCPTNWKFIAGVQVRFYEVQSSSGLG